MSEFEIQFDPDKAEANFRKHGVHLADAEGVFYDPAMREKQDNDHGEQRFVAVGNDGAGNILAVAYTYRDPNFVRVISARKATKRERAQYEAK